MTGPGHDLAHRVPKRVPTEQWEPSHGREVLERLLGALTELRHDPLPVSLDVVQASLDSVIGEGAYPTGPTIQDLTGRLRDHLRELGPVIRKRAGSTARRRDAKALRRVECLLRAEDPLTMTQARQYLDDLATATRDMLCCLVIGLRPDGTAPAGLAPSERVEASRARASPWRTLRSRLIARRAVCPLRASN
ncbi:DUF6415 family natural product biosynthesis protein [Streptomyces katsurahamanus]|uniref:DUF6415 family natural product biosynthesis protein n=1 Tax=Streptomyces katsurahamanus TaxID=2577098 RepID=UPI00389A31A9